MSFYTFYIFILLSTFCSNCASNARDPNTMCPVTLGEVYNFALDKSNGSTAEDIQLYFKTFKDFNFKEFSPIEGEVNPDFYYKLGYTKTGKLIEIHHYEIYPKYNNFRMVLYDTSNFVILSFENWYDDYERNGEYGSDYLPGVFVYLKQEKITFFINTMKHFNEKVVEHFYDGNYPIGKFQEISSIVELDENLYPTRLIKISKGLPILGSESKYLDDNYLSKELLFLLNVPDYLEDNPLIIEEKTCLNNIVDQVFQKKSSPIFCLETDPNNVVSVRLAKQPLWLQEGLSDKLRWHNCTFK